MFSFKQKHLPTICPVHISLSILEQQPEISSCFHLNKALLDSSAPQKSAMIITVVLLSQMNLFHDEPPLQKQRGEYGRMAWGRRYRDDKTRTQAVSDGVKEVFILLDATMAVLYRKIFWLCQVHSNVLMGQMPQCFQFFQFPSAKKKKLETWIQIFSLIPKLGIERPRVKQGHCPGSPAIESEVGCAGLK